MASGGLLLPSLIARAMEEEASTGRPSTSGNVYPVLRPGPMRKVTTRSSRTSSRVRMSSGTRTPVRRPVGTAGSERRATLEGPATPRGRARIADIVNSPPALKSNRPKRPSGFMKAYLRLFGESGKQKSKQSKKAKGKAKEPVDPQELKEPKENLELARVQERAKSLEFALDDAKRTIAMRDERVTKCEKEIKRLRRVTRAMEVERGAATLVPDPKELSGNLPEDSEERLELLRKQRIRINELESMMRTVRVNERHPPLLDRPRFETQLKSLQQELTRQTSNQPDADVPLSDDDSIATQATQKRINKKLKAQLKQSREAHEALKASLEKRDERQTLELIRESDDTTGTNTTPSTSSGRTPQIEANASRRRSVRARDASVERQKTSSQHVKDVDFMELEIKLADMGTTLDATKLALAESITQREKLESKLRSSKRLLRKALQEAEQARDGLLSPGLVDGAPRTVNDLDAANDQIRALTANMRKTSESREATKAKLDSAKLELARMAAENEKREASTQELERHLTTLENAWNSGDNAKQRSRLSAEVRIAELTSQVDKHRSMKAELIDITRELDELQTEVQGIKGLKGEVKSLRRENKRLSEQLLRSSLMGAYEITIIEETGNVSPRLLHHDDDHAISERGEGEDVLGGLQPGGTPGRRSRARKPSLSQSLDERRYSAVELSTAIAQTQQNFVNAKVHQDMKRELAAAQSKITALEEEKRGLIREVGQMSPRPTSKLDNHLDALRLQMHEAEEKLAGEEKRRQDLETELNTIRPLKKELETSRAEHADAMNRLQGLAQMRNIFEQRLAAHSQLEDEHTLLQVQHAELMEQLQTAGESKGKLEEKSAELYHVRQELEQSYSELDKIRQDLETLRTEHAEALENLQAFEKDREELDSAREEIASLQETKQVADQTTLNFDTLLAEHQKLEHEMEEVLLQQAKLLEQIRTANTDKEVMQGEIDSSHQEIDRLYKLTRELESMRESLSDSEEQSASLKAERDAHAEKADMAQAKVEELEHQLVRKISAEEEATRLQGFDFGLINSTCDDPNVPQGRDVASEEHAAEVRRLETLLHDLQIEKDDLARRKLNEAHTALAQLDATRTELENTKANNTQLIARIEELTAASATLEERQTQRNDLENKFKGLLQVKQADEAAAVAKISELYMQLGQSKAQISKLETAMEANTANHEKATADLAAEREEHEQSKRHLVEVRAQTDKLKEQKEEVEARLTRLQADMARSRQASRERHLNELQAKAGADDEQLNNLIAETKSLEQERDHLQEELQLTQASLESQKEENEIEHEALQMQLAAFEKLSEQLEELTQTLEVSRGNEAELRAILDRYENEDRLSDSPSDLDGAEEDRISPPGSHLRVRDDEEQPRSRSRSAQGFALQLESITEEDDEDGADARSISSSTTDVDPEVHLHELEQGLYPSDRSGSASRLRVRNEDLPEERPRSRNPLESQLEDPEDVDYSDNEAEEDPPHLQDAVRILTSTSRPSRPSPPPPILPPRPSSQQDSNSPLSPRSDHLVSPVESSSRPSSAASSFQEGSRQGRSRQQISRRDVSRGVAERVNLYETLSQRVERRRREAVEEGGE